MSNEEIKSNNTRPIKQGKFDKDKGLEEAIMKSQESLSNLSHILRDYIYLDVNSAQHHVMKRRTKSEFYQDFNQEIEMLKSLIVQIQSFFPKKNLDAYTIVMKIIDVGSVGTLAWFRYNLVVILDVVKTYIERINYWNSSDEDENYKGFYILEGDTSFLHDMCCDISSFLYDLYMLKAYEYADYVRKSRIREDDNPFVRYMMMPKMMKTHKAHSRTLLDTCNGVLHRTFYKDDMNAVPLMTSILRQMIELRFEELLGIQVIYKDERHTEIAKVVGSTYFELPDFEEFTVLPIPLSALKAIYGWASEYVHRGVSDYYWIIFYVEQYLLAFILGDAYMEECYFDGLKSKIASLFKVTEKHIVWRDNTNLRKTTSERLEIVRKEISNKGYWIFHDKENAREQKELEMYMKKKDIFQMLTKKIPYIYKVDDKYYIVGYYIFEECEDSEFCSRYDQLVSLVKELETDIGKDIKAERLDSNDLRQFIPMFNSIRDYCDEQERRFKSEWNFKEQSDSNMPVEKHARKMIAEMLSELNDNQIEQLSDQFIDFGWMYDQSIRLEALEKGMRSDK